jgi:DNA-binding NarL/FixJ family response regulator
VTRRILLVDDHPSTRKGLALTLSDEPDLTVAAAVGSAEEALAALVDVEVDLVVTDLSLPGMSGIELVKHVHALRPGLPVLVVSRHDEGVYAERALRAGARGYVSKLEADDVLVGAVRRVLKGGVHVSDDVQARLLGRSVGRDGDPTAGPTAVLSDRELEVFEATGRGAPTREIAERMHLSVKTVESYRARIKEKLGLGSAAELMQHAVRWVEEERR